MDRKQVPLANQNPPPGLRPLGSRAWTILFAVLVVCITLAEAGLLELGAMFFTGGFNYPHVDTPIGVAGFFLGSLTADAFLVFAVWMVAVPLFRRLFVSPVSSFVAVASLSLAIPAMFDLLRYRLFAVLGRGVSLDNLFELGAGSASMMATEVSLQLRGALSFFLLALIALLLVAWASHKASRVWPHASQALEPAPRFSVLAMGCALAGLASSLVFVFPGNIPAQILTGLRAKPAGLLVIEAVQFTTDVDRDGHGLLSRPGDNAPFDNSIHPFALDLPSNQIDENGIGGDHPRGFVPVHLPPIPASEVVGPARPLLVIFLESFRTDLLGDFYNGKEITPFLNRLGREGASSQQAFANTPSTVPSRAQLFRGDIEWQREESSWVDDFQSRGYHVAHFSGQDDSLNGSGGYMGTDRSDTFYDARGDIAKRTSRTANAMSLQVSWKTVLKRVEDFLTNYDARTPLFLYVNIVDTHFPYHHDEIDDLLEITPIARGEITRDRVEDVRATYANTAANVDLAIEKLVTTWWQYMGRDSGILITSDHGQSFYENGVLGHGQFLDNSHTRVPLILWGIGGDWPEPVSMADVRSLVRKNLSSTEAGPARFVPDPDRWIFQYAYSLDHPRRIQLRGLNRRVGYSFAAGETELSGSLEDLRQSGEGDLAFQRRMTDWLIRNWEAHQLRASDPERSR